jgi:hypothetical protein
MLQADRTGLSPQDVKAKITALWRSTNNGQEFAVALWNEGYALARGDRRDFVVIDPHGGTHSLARRIEGANAKNVRERMADLDRERLPNVLDAKEIQKARQARNASAGQNKQPVATSVPPEEELKRRNRGPDNLEWTDEAGMVAQERSAIEWHRKLSRRADDTSKQPMIVRDRLNDTDRDPTNGPGAGRDRGRSR